MTEANRATDETTVLAKIENLWDHYWKHLLGFMAVVLSVCLLVFVEHLWEEVRPKLTIAMGWHVVVVGVVVAALTAFWAGLMGKQSAGRAYREALHTANESWGEKLKQLKDVIDAIPVSTEEIRHSHAEVKYQFEGFLHEADGVVKMAERVALHEMWLSRPWEYLKLLREAEAARSGSEGFQHISSVGLFGTMVGFAFLLPDALRNHACRIKDNFITLKIYASDAGIEIQEELKHLVHYPLWLVASFVEETLFRCQSFRSVFSGPSPHSFTIEIIYFPHDLMNAAIHLPPQEITVLQAYDMSTFRQVVDEKRRQVGFRYLNSADQQDAYDRYASAMRNLHTSSRKKETWTISGNGAGELVVRITNPHWQINVGDHIDVIEMASDYDLMKEGQLVKQGDVQIRSLLDGLKQAIRAAGSSGKDVKELDNYITSRKEEWRRREQMECDCKLRPAGDKRKLREEVA